MRGMNIAPHFLPADTCMQRIQHDDFSSHLPSRSQKNCTLMRPYLSGQISSSFGPVTTAVCEPRMIGLRAIRIGRNVTESGMQVNELEYSRETPLPPSYVAGSIAVCAIAVMT